MPADGLAPLGARPSAGTVMTQVPGLIYTQDQLFDLLYPRSTKLKGGYTGMRLSVCPSVPHSPR